MKPTIPWMQQAFNIYNKKYFEGKLKTPNFSLQCPPGNWGFYLPNGTFNEFTRRVSLNGPGTICLSPQYSRLEKDLINTMLHEMIHMYINTVLLKYPRNKHGEEFQAWAQKLNQDGWNISERNEKQATDTTEDNEEIEYSNMEIKPHIFCLIEQPNDENNKIWGFKADYNTLNDYISTAKKLKKIGVSKLWVYYCYSGNMENMATSPKTLDGIGAQNVNDLITKLSRLLKEKLTKDNFKLIENITL